MLSHTDWIEKENVVTGVLNIHHNRPWFEWNASNWAIILKDASLLFSFPKKFEANKWN